MEKYEEVKIEILEFENVDVITGSGSDTNGDTNGEES